MRLLPAILAALALAGCATTQKLDAAGDVHALLVAIRDNDQSAFDARVDRPALRYAIQQRIRPEAGRDERLSGLAALLAPGLARLADDLLVQPAVFRVVAEHYGYSRTAKIPNAFVISQALRRLPDGRVCALAEKGGPCLLDFTQGADDRWRLSGFEGDLGMLRLKR